MKVSNIYKLPNDTMKLTTNNVKKLSYFNLAKEKVTLPDGRNAYANEIYTLPSYVTSIYIKDVNDNENGDGVLVELPTNIPVVSKVVKKTT